MQMRLILVFFGLGAAVWSYARWRQAVQAALFLVILEGAIRKWLFPGAQDVVYFAKDLLFLGAYGGWFAARRPRSPIRLKALQAPLVLAALYGGAQMFNPRLPTPLVGIFGFKAYFWYVPLLFLLPDVFTDDRALARFLKRYVLTAIPVGLLGVAQFFSPASSPLNTYARAAEDVGYVSTFGSSAFVRVTATFSYITGYSSYLFAVTILLLGILATIQWRFRRNLIFYVALGMTMLGILLTGSRGPLVLLAAAFPFYWWLAVARERGAGATFSRLILAVGVVVMLISYTASDAVDAYLGRAAGGAGDVAGRLLLPFEEPFLTLPQSGLFGFGIGATHQTAAAVVKDRIPYSWLDGLEVEGEPGRIMLELGLPGFLLFYFLRLYLAFVALQQARRLRSLFHRSMATASFLFFLAQLPGNIVFDVTTDVYHWFFAGLLLTVMTIDRATGLAARAAAPPVAATAPELGVSRPAPLPAGARLGARPLGDLR
jgi:hypothetical protein